MKGPVVMGGAGRAGFLAFSAESPGMRTRGAARFPRRRWSPRVHGEKNGLQPLIFSQIPVLREYVILTRLKKNYQV